MFNRPVSATTRQETEMINRSIRAINNVTDPIEKLRLLCLSRGASGIIGLSRTFKLLDNDGNKQLNKEELTEGLAEYGLKLSEEEINVIMEKLDTDGSGEISLDEFIVAIRPPINDNRKKLVDQAFEKLDKSGDGEITVDDLRGVYNVKYHPRYISGEESEESIMKKFLSNFEVGKTTDGIVTKEEFLNYYSAISASIDHDAYFDLMMRNALFL